MAAIRQPTPPPTPAPFAPQVFVSIAALFIFVVLLKFGTPVILDNLMQPPEGFNSAIYESWQIKWAYRFLIPVIVAAFAAVQWKSLEFRWWLALPLGWLGWQFIAAKQTISPMLTLLTLEHFSACVVLFYSGYFAMKGVRYTWPLWTAVALALCWIIHFGFEQHFGGLEATRQYLAKLKESGVLNEAIVNDPNYMKRIAGNRIFATFSNPDALAGCVLFLLPVTLAFLWQLTPKVRPTMRWSFVVILGGCGLACIYWSGSKAGWLVTLIMGVVALLHSNLPKSWKRGVIAAVLVLGVIGFGLRYAGYFQKQKNSAGARFTYWHAALRIVHRYPLLGSGPGTFSILYGELKKPDDEMARLCHNDYLEQACDAGLPSFLLYSGMIIGYLIYLYRYRMDCSIYNLRFALWLGLTGLCVHSAVEYHLYIPALAWPLFFFLGFLMNSDG